MSKWLIVLLALASLLGVVWLERTEPPKPAAAAPSTRTATTSSTPAARVTPAPTTPVAVASQTPSRVVETPAAPITQTPPELPARVAPAVQTASQDTALVVPMSDARWVGLPVDRFLLQASGDLVRLSPETMTYLGLSKELGVRDDQLDPLTAAAEADYYNLAQAIANHLATYDLTREPPADRLNAEIYGAWLEDVLAGRPFADNGYAISSYMDSYPTYIAWFLTSLHPLDTPTHADDYLARLRQIPARFRELQARLVRSEAVGAVPPRFILEQAVAQLQSVGATPARASDLYGALAAALDEMADVEPAALLARAEELLDQDVLPAYRELAEFVSGMARRATDDAGVWKQDNGDAYYAYCLASLTTTDLTPDEIHELGVSEVARIEREIRSAAADVGLNATLPIPDLFAALTELTGESIGEETLTRCQVLLDDIVPRVAPAFRRMPTRDLVVVDGGFDTYFSAGTLDGSRPGQFFMPTQMPQPIYGLATVTYHEAVPGHGLQAAYAYDAGIPPYLAGLSFTAYAEGWALYAERLAWEMGAYDENPYGNLGRLQDELFRAARLVLDTGLHAKRWTYEEAVSYMLDHTGFTEPYVRAEVERYIVLPAQAVTYKVGMQKMLELRDEARQALGDRFELPSFHEAVLGYGELPFWLLEQRVDAYIADTLRDAAETAVP